MLRASAPPWRASIFGPVLHCSIPTAMAFDSSPLPNHSVAKPTTGPRVPRAFHPKDCGRRAPNWVHAYRGRHLSVDRPSPIDRVLGSLSRTRCGNRPVHGCAPVGLVAPDSPRRWVDIRRNVLLAGLFSSPSRPARVADARIRTIMTPSELSSAVMILTVHAFRTRGVASSQPER
jgi:hypothetical protein